MHFVGAMSYSFPLFNSILLRWSRTEKTNCGFENVGLVTRYNELLEVVRVGGRWTEEIRRQTMKESCERDCNICHERAERAKVSSVLN